MKLSYCRYCGAQILWLRSVSTGKIAPIDAHTREGGNVLVDFERETYAVAPAPPSVAYTNHFATCPAVRARKIGDRK